MGGRMVKRLIDAGHTVTGHNRTRSKARWLEEAGMRWADSPRAVAEASMVTFSMVTDTAALRAITEDPDGLLAGIRPGALYVDMSTVSPAASREVAAALRRGAPACWMPRVLAEKRDRSVSGCSAIGMVQASQDRSDADHACLADV
jgi:3-hydroxyisobutyrate dehydrogenase-like beta-hydroxyacid dehydrogenase